MRQCTQKWYHDQSLPSAGLKRVSLSLSVQKQISCRLGLFSGFSQKRFFSAFCSFFFCSRRGNHNARSYNVDSFQVLIVLLLVIPAIASGIALQFKSSYANDILMSCFAIASTHAFIEFGCTLYFIKRYRLFIARRIRVALDGVWPNRNKSGTENLRVTYFTSRSTD